MKNYKKEFRVFVTDSADIKALTDNLQAFVNSHKETSYERVACDAC